MNHSANAVPSLKDKALNRPDLIVGGILSLLNAHWHRLKFFLLLKKVKMGRGVRIYGTLRVIGPVQVSIGEGCLFIGNQGLPNVIVGSERGARVEIGRAATFGGCSLRCSTSITIGALCSLASGTIITDTQAHSLCKDRRTNPGAPIAKEPVHIEENCWLSLNTIVIHGVTIHRDSVVAAGAVVTRDVPEATIVAGVPAKVIGAVPASEVEHG